MRLNRTEAKAGGKNSCCIPDPPPQPQAQPSRGALNQKASAMNSFLSFPSYGFSFRPKWIPLIFVDFSQSVAKIFYIFFFFRLLINHNISNLSRHLSQPKCILRSKHPPTLYLHTYVGSFSLWGQLSDTFVMGERNK